MGRLIHDSKEDFARGGLDGLSRAIKAEMHDAAVVVEEEIEDTKYADRKFCDTEGGV